MKLITVAMSSFLVIWAVCLCLFIVKAAKYETEVHKDTDKHSMVILTGGKNRIGKALLIIDKDRTKNIFISGVYEKTSLKDILANWEFPQGISIILGKEAKNTRENALEISGWAKNNRIQTILLVTSDYHMQRSIAEITAINKKLNIVPYAIKSSKDFVFFRHCAKEFHKLILVYIRFIFLR